MREERRIYNFEQLERELGIQDISGLLESKRLQKKVVQLLPEMSVELKTELAELLHIVYFACPKEIWSAKDFRKSPPPSSSGVYGWYFDCYELPPHVPYIECSVREDGWWLFKKYWILLYIGKASNLRERIVDEHLQGNLVRGKAQSSLRQSVGCLLCKRLGINLWKYPDFPRREYTFGYEGEKKLSDWIKKHTRVAWVETANASELEEDTIEYYTLPLNTQGNVHWFIDLLKTLKKGLRDCSPFLDFKPSKRAIRKTYKKFVKRCKFFEKAKTR